MIVQKSKFCGIKDKDVLNQLIKNKMLIIDSMSTISLRRGAKLVRRRMTQELSFSWPPSIHIRSTATLQLSYFIHRHSVAFEGCTAEKSGHGRAPPIRVSRRADQFQHNNSFSEIHHNYHYILQHPKYESYLHMNRISSHMVCILSRSFIQMIMLYINRNLTIRLMKIYLI